MTALPPPGTDTETAPLDPLSEQYEAGREMLGIEPGLDAIDLVEIGDSTMELNMGPMHPSTHGVLRLVLNLDGEVVRECRPDIGYLHTGFEKDFERHTYQQCIPYTDRMDYLSPLFNNLGFSLAVEKLLGIEVPLRGQYLRVIMCELCRLASHLLWYGTSALDLGATTAFVYAWRDREKLLDINELVSGVRMHTSFIRVGGLLADVPDPFYEMVGAVIKTFPKLIDEHELLITKNPIWRQRTIGLGRLSPAMRWHTAPPGRCSAAAASRTTSARPSPTAHTTTSTSTSRSDGRGCLRPLPRAHAGDAGVAEDHHAGPREPPRRSGEHHRPPRGAPGAQRAQHEHGVAHPPLQARHRRDARPGRSGLPGGGVTPWRARLLPGERRRQPAYRCKVARHPSATSARCPTWSAAS